MTDKQIIVDGIDVSECISLDKYYIANCKEEFIDCALGGLYEYQDEYKRTCKENPNCYYKQLQREKQNSQEARDTAIKEFNRKEELNTLYKHKEQECDELKKIINEAKSSSLDLQSFLVGEAVQNEYEQQLDQLKAKNEELIRRITKIFACLIKANRTNKIVDTLWVDNITTLWDYIAQTLGIEGDQVQIEEQILQKISELENDNK